MHSRIAAPLLAAALAVAPRAAAAAAEPDFAALGRLVVQTKRATDLPSGTAVAVVRDGRIVYEGYFGLSDIAKRIPVTRNTAFYIASATKPFFALSVLLDEDARRLDTRTSLQQMFPQTRFDGFDAASVTLKDLLVHTSGIDNQPLVWATAYSGIHDAESRRALVAASYPNAKAKHGTFDYTNVGYAIASVWLDRTVGTPWQRQLDATIFRPLAMTHTTASIRTARAAGWSIAKPYSFASETPRNPLYLVKADETLHAAGGLVSTAPDLARFLIAQLSDGAIDGRQLLPATVIARSHETQATLEEKYQDFARSGYAWGWYTGIYKGRTLLHHFGGFAGFHAHLSFMPEANAGLVVLSNDDVLGAQTANLIADHVYGVLLEQPDTQTTSSRRFAEMQAKAATFRASAGKRRAEIRARTWNLSLPRERYAGRYAHPQLGTMTVELERDGAMVIRWGRLAAIATAYEDKDHVRVEFAPNSGEVLAFAVNGESVEAIAFDRMVFAKRR
ncbi:MAG TPA: serine hydrolase [Tahibacter sp.]|uniref:serine hydrolase n=1 Tax=Tahibacter sp. TaxID=2056211 RepID=UPI002B6FBFEB|nr:serine hydrolase [Tahibacter sp.]HSX61073.1 serine hydrolase [Tahibacter sp.]